MDIQTKDRTDRIRQLNDAFRSSLIGGRVMLTQGVDCLPPERKQALFREVRTYDKFDEGNDPHGEHDFGAIDFEGVKYFWKVDYYDHSLQAGSEDPADPKKTARVLTVMRADEY